MGDLLYLTPTIIPGTKTQAATVVSIAATTNADGLAVWAIVAELNTALTTPDRVGVEYARRPAKPCPVAVGDTIRIPVAPPV